MTKRPAPIAIPHGLTREDVLFYICQAIEGAPDWARGDQRMVALVDEMMVSQDIYATLRRFIPNAEWLEAYTLIATRAKHHAYYQPLAVAPLLAQPDASHDGAHPAKVEEIKKGEYVKRKADATKVYQRGAYDASTKRYALIDCDDIAREIFVAKGTVLFIGFTY